MIWKINFQWTVTFQIRIQWEIKVFRRKDSQFIACTIIYLWNQIITLRKKRAVNKRRKIQHVGYWSIMWCIINVACMPFSVDVWHVENDSLHRDRQKISRIDNCYRLTIASLEHTLLYNNFYKRTRKKLFET